MCVTDFLPYDACSLLQVKVGNYHRAVAAGMPMVKQNFSLFAVVDHVVVTNNIDSPGSAQESRLDNAIVLLQPESEPRRTVKRMLLEEPD